MKLALPLPTRLAPGQPLKASPCLCDGRSVS